MHQRRRRQQQIENHCADSWQTVEDEEVECDDEPNPQDRPAGPNVLPLEIEQNDSASVISHAEELIGLDGQECDALAPAPSASGNGSW